MMYKADNIGYYLRNKLIIYEETPITNMFDMFSKFCAGKLSIIINSILLNSETTSNKHHSSKLQK